MICRKQGRRSAQTAEETKHQILATAGSMFCNLGFEKVSLRSISEAAGVSHSLIRHHFGSKEQIWYTVSDTLNAYMQEYIKELIKVLPADKPANVILYHFAMKMMAHMLLNPQPLQFIADAVRQEGEFFDYFLDKTGEFETIIQNLVDKHNNENPDYIINLMEFKWQMIYTAHAATSLKPLLNTIWKNNAKDNDDVLLNHWKLFNKQIQNQFNIQNGDVIKPENIRALLLPIACDFSTPETCVDSLSQYTSKSV